MRHHFSPSLFYFTPWRKMLIKFAILRPLTIPTLSISFVYIWKWWSLWRMPWSVRWMPGFARWMPGFAKWMPGSVRWTLGVVWWMPRELRWIYWVVRWIPWLVQGTPYTVLSANSSCSDPTFYRSFLITDSEL